MKVFSDIPEFILDEYLDDILETYDSTPIETVDVWDNVLFLNNGNVVFNSTDFVKFNLSFTIGDKSSMTDSYLKSPGHNIISKGDKRIEAYIETETNYQEIGLLTVNDYKTKAEDGYGAYYEFGISEEKYPLPSDVIDYTLTETTTGSQSYVKFEFVYYDCFQNPIYKTLDEKIGQKVLLKKGDVFSDWGKNKYSDHINFNKDFIYLGDVYPYESEFKCKIYRYLFKDLVINFLPPNNRTPKLSEFISIIFDQIYNKIYKQQKNLKTLYDGLESDAKYLNDLTTGIYDINIDKYGLIKEDRLRDLVRNMPIILKKKGTYSSLIGIWKFITGFDSTIDNRDINIYEWWHNTLPKYNYTVPSSGIVEVNYITQYDTAVNLTGCAGNSYYSQYTNQYPSFYDTTLTDVMTNSYIHKQMDASTKWEATHWINDDQLLIQCYDVNFIEIMPKTISIPDKSVCILEFEKAVAGYCIFAKVSYGELKKGSYWEISHYINKKSVLSQAFSTFNEKFSPKNIYRKDYDNDLITIDNDNEDGYGYFLKGEYIYHSRTDQSIWNITHNINALLLVQCYDDDDNLIMPGKVDQSNFRTLSITFNKAVNGYVILKRIGNPTNTGYTNSVMVSGGKTILDDTIGTVLSPHYKIEMDLTCKPIDPDGIFTKDTAQNLYDNLEEIRSVDRVSHYHNVIAPLTDFSGNVIGTYNKQYNPYLYSKYISSSNLSGIATHTQSTSASTWYIAHNTKSSNLIVYVYDEDYNLIYPDYVKIIDIFNLEIHFSTDTPQNGYAIIVNSDKLDYIYGSTDSNIIHNYNRNVISQFYTLTSNDNIFPETIINNENLLYVSASEDGYAQLVEGNFLFTTNSALKTWTISHNFNSIGLIAEFFDSSWNKIFPDELTLTDSNTCTVTFSEAISGYGVLKNTGYINNKNDIKNDLLTHGAVVKLGNGTDKSYIDNTDITDVQTSILTIDIDKNDIYVYGTDLCIDIKLDIETEYDIREIGIFNNNQTLMYFYSHCSQLYKNNKYTMTIHYLVKYDEL